MLSLCSSQSLPAYALSSPPSLSLFCAIVIRRLFPSKSSTLHTTFGPALALKKTMRRPMSSVSKLYKSGEAWYSIAFLLNGKPKTQLQVTSYSVLDLLFLNSINYFSNLSRNCTTAALCLHRAVLKKREAFKKCSLLDCFVLKDLKDKSMLLRLCSVIQSRIRTI